MNKDQPKVYGFMKLAEVLLIAAADIPHLKELAHAAKQNYDPGLRISRFYFGDGSVLAFDSVTETATTE